MPEIVEKDWNSPLSGQYSNISQVTNREISRMNAENHAINIEKM